MKINHSIHHSFTAQLLHWHLTENQRSLVWKEEKDPYKIWLSEIILQQTRTEQGKPYYLKFIQHYPTVTDLANAPFEEVMKLWQGLGYYSRCANLHKAAKIVAQEYQGIFPTTYDAIIALSGVGPYTAAAIASFAYQLPYPVIDGNVYRILARYFGIQTPVDTTEGKKIIAEKAVLLLDASQAGIYNQAIMDLGATVCKPQNPECITCPLHSNCVAFQQGMQKELPIKIKKINIRQRHLHYILLVRNGDIYMEERKEKDIWQHLHQPFLKEKETAEKLDIKELPEWIQVEKLQYLGQEKQKLTHQLVHTYWYHYSVEEMEDISLNKTSFLSKKKLAKIALPKSIFSFMSKNNYF